MTPAERRARGKAARAEVPREIHAVWTPPADRPDPVALMESQGAAGVPDLVPVRYGRMMATPFTYYRGAALPMASDLAMTPVSGPMVQASGDAHLSNFGIFDSAERGPVFDLDDFDETLPAPWEWDVKRLAASLEVAARDNAFSGKQRREVVMTAVAGYRQAMRTFAGMGDLNVWYARLDADQLRTQLTPELRTRRPKRMDADLAKARITVGALMAGKLTRLVDGRVRIISDPPLLVPIDELIPTETDDASLEAFLPDMITQYRRTLETDSRFLLERFQFSDMARKVVGVGSVGTRCWIILMLGRDQADPLFLQVKEAQESVLSRFAGASKYANQGERVVVGQRLIQASRDIFLGWQRTEAGLDGESRDFYIRQLRDRLFSFDLELMAPDGMRTYGALCGKALARAHARSGDRIAIAAYLGRSDAFERAVTDFAAVYADQNERDYKSFIDTVASGRISVKRDL